MDCKLCQNLTFRNHQCVRPTLSDESEDGWKCSYCIADGVMGGQKSRGFRKDAVQAVAEMDQMRRSLTEKRRTDVPLETAAASGCRKCQSELKSGIKNDCSHDYGCPLKRFQKVKQMCFTCVEDQPSKTPEEVKPGKPGSSDWSEKEDAELTKLVNKHGTSWRDCLDDSRTFQIKYEHISDESARDRLRRRWRTLRKNADTVDWSKQDYTEDDVRNEICRQVDIHGTDWKQILTVSSREFKTFDSSSMRSDLFFITDH